MVAIAAIFVLGACRVDVSIAIDAQADGRGEVRVTAVLDDEAAKEAGDLSVRVRTEDLEDAGWVVERPRRRPGGGAALTVRHRFASEDDARRVLAQLAGPIEGLTIAQERSFFRTTTRFRGTVDLRDGVAAFSDEQLTAALGGQPLGVAPEVLEQRMGTTFDRVFGMEIYVTMPGADARWEPRFGERTPLTATARRWNLANIALLVVAMASTAALGLVLYARGRARTDDAATTVD